MQNKERNDWPRCQRRFGLLQFVDALQLPITQTIRPRFNTQYKITQIKLSTNSIFISLITQSNLYNTKARQHQFNCPTTDSRAKLLRLLWPMSEQGSQRIRYKHIITSEWPVSDYLHTREAQIDEMLLWPRILHQHLTCINSLDYCLISNNEGPLVCISKYKFAFN